MSSEEKDGNLAVIHLNVLADLKPHKRDYVFKSTTYRMNVHSTVVHPLLHRL